MHHWSIPCASWLLWRWLTTLWLGCLAVGAWAAESSVSPMLPHDLAVLPDPGGMLDISTVANPARFKTVPSGSYSGGFTRSAHWCQNVIHNLLHAIDSDPNAVYTQSAQLASLIGQPDAMAQVVALLG